LHRHNIVRQRAEYDNSTSVTLYIFAGSDIEMRVLGEHEWAFAQLGAPSWLERGEHLKRGAMKKDDFG